MSAIPPNWMASIIQTAGAQDRAGSAAKAEASSEAERSGPASFTARLQDAVEGVETDNQVHPDAHGAGGQGRAPSESPSDEQSAANEAESSGGLDLLA